MNYQCVDLRFDSGDPQSGFNFASTEAVHYKYSQVSSARLEVKLFHKNIIITEFFVLFSSTCLYCILFVVFLLGLSNIDFPCLQFTLKKLQ